MIIAYSVCHLSDFPMDSSNGNCRGTSSGEYTSTFLLFVCVHMSLRDLSTQVSFGYICALRFKSKLKKITHILFKTLAFTNIDVFSWSLKIVWIL